MSTDAAPLSQQVGIFTLKEEREKGVFVGGQNVCALLTTERSRKAHVTPRTKRTPQALASG